jgi:ribosomal protein L37E
MKDKGLSILLKVKGFTARKCGNCGQETLRTEDWACQWCGYPLLSSKSCEVIPKTYRELKEERRRHQKPAEVEAEATVEPEPLLESKLESELEQIPEPEPESVLQPQPASVPKAIELTVDELLSAYATDEAAAHERFEHNILKVTGIVRRIGVADFLDFDYINLTSTEDNLSEHVRCFFDKRHRLEVSQLITGQKVTVQGTHSGSIVYICLRDCVLVS